MRIVDYTKFVLLMLGVIMLTGCASNNVKTKPYTAGSIWVLPVEDAIVEQNGNVKPREGTGAEFEQYLAKCFSRPFTAKTSVNRSRILSADLTSEELFSHARQMRVDYMLRTSFGKVHLAEPGTRRPDYAYLEKAYLVDVEKRVRVWELSRPLYVEKSNGGKNSVLLKFMAAYVVDSINDHAEPSARRR